MRAYKCDICGNLYETEKENLKLKKGLYIFMNYKENDLSYNIDLCPDCTDAIQKIIDSRRSDKCWK